MQLQFCLHLNKERLTQHTATARPSKCWATSLSERKTKYIQTNRINYYYFFCSFSLKCVQRGTWADTATEWAGQRGGGGEEGVGWGGFIL